MAACARSLLGPSRPGSLALAAYQNLLGIFKNPDAQSLPTTSGMGSELFKKSSRDSVKRGLRTNEVDQVAHFIVGEADYQEMWERARMGTASLDPQARCGTTFGLRGSPWGSLQTLSCEEEGW